MKAPGMARKATAPRPRGRRRFAEGARRALRLPINVNDAEDAFIREGAAHADKLALVWGRLRLLEAAEKELGRKFVPPKTLPGK